MNLKVFAIVAIVFSPLSLNPGFAQSLPGCASAVSDSDGDGFGFENGQSCLVGGSQQPTSPSFPNCTPGSQEMITVIDGFGFENGQSCLVLEQQAPSTSLLNCASADSDSDGDGFGFENGQSCLVVGVQQPVSPSFPNCTPGSQEMITVIDGFGFENGQSCLVHSTGVNDVSVIGGNDPSVLDFQVTSELAVNINTDASWQFCDTRSGNTLSQNQSFGTFPDFLSLNSSGFPARACVRRCDDEAVLLTDLPGWGFDANAGAECIFGDTDNASNSVVPIFLEGSVQPQEFEERFAFPLYEGDGFWQCSIEARNSNRDAFAARGSEITFQLTREGDNWFFGDRSDRQTLRIEVETGDATQFVYDGFVQIDHNNLTIYRTSLERLNCSRLNMVEDMSLPVKISSFVEAPSVPSIDLLGQTTRCQAVESLQRTDSNPSQTGRGFGNSISNNFEITPEFLFANDDGNFVYDLGSGVSLSNFLFVRDITSDGDVFFRREPTGTSSIFTTLRFRDVGEQVMAERLDFRASSGQRTRRFSYFVCDSAT